MAEPFLAEATRLGRGLARGALRSHGQATWLADGVALVDGNWQPTVGTVGPDFATGTAGIGWFLARCAAIAREQALADVAVEALRHGLERADALRLAGRLDWYEGASGVAWAAIDAGRALDSAELVERGTQVAMDVVRAAREAKLESESPALVGGASGVLAGLLALAVVEGDLDPGQAVAGYAARLAETVSEAAVKPEAGLARGLSGIGLVLARTAFTTGRTSFGDAARQALTLERTLFEPGIGWYAPAAHPWATQEALPDASWCRGAAGIGLARLGARGELPDLLLLAEAGAAIELVRGHLATLDHSDASICHGTAGAIELLLCAGVLLREEVHVHAARTAGLALIGPARSGGGYASGFGARTRNPSLLFGLAGTATLLLRLHEGGTLPSPALPPLSSA